MVNVFLQDNMVGLGPKGLSLIAATDSHGNLYPLLSINHIKVLEILPSDFILPVCLWLFYS